MSDTTSELPISADLLEILRDPAAVQEPEKYGTDPGRLELVHNSWLVSNDTGYKYPIRDGIPVMLIEEGERWKNTAVADLPVPPQRPAQPESPPLPADLYAGSDPGGLNPLIMVIGTIVGLVALIGLWRWLFGDD